SRALMNVVSIWRIRSGDAWVSRSDRNAWGSISWGAVIAGVPFEWDVGVSSKASRGDRCYFAVDTPTGVNVLRDSYTTLPDATVACYQCHDPQQLGRWIARRPDVPASVIPIGYSRGTLSTPVALSIVAGI